MANLLLNGINRKVFGLGLSRTGTTTLTEALNILGIKAIHFPNDDVTCNELIKGKYNLSLLKEYQAITDIVVSPFYAEFDKVYPGSKFILTVRNMASWLQSIERHWQLWVKREQIDAFTNFIINKVYGTLEYDKDTFSYIYDKHLKNVCSYFALRLNDLLIFNIIEGDSWKELCSFLGLTVPDVPFPHLNKIEKNREWVQRLDRVIKDLQVVVHEGAAFVFVGGNELGLKIVPGREAIPFIERNGNYWGPPPDDGAAIHELERLRQAGANYLVFAWPAFWWLEYYKDFHTYLRLKFPCIFKSEHLIVFDLWSRLGGGGISDA